MISKEQNVFSAVASEANLKWKREGLDLSEIMTRKKWIVVISMTNFAKKKGGGFYPPPRSGTYVLIDMN